MTTCTICGEYGARESSRTHDPQTCISFLREALRKEREAQERRIEEARREGKLEAYQKALKAAERFQKVDEESGEIDGWCALCAVLEVNVNEMRDSSKGGQKISEVDGTTPEGEPGTAKRLPPAPFPTSDKTCAACGGEPLYLEKHGDKFYCPSRACRPSDKKRQEEGEGFSPSGLGTGLDTGE
jgi:hypothetical protein